MACPAAPGLPLQPPASPAWLPAASVLEPVLLSPPPEVCQPALTGPPLLSWVPRACAGRGSQSSRAPGILGGSEPPGDMSGEPAPGQRPQAVPVGSKEPSQDQLQDLGGPCKMAPCSSRVRNFRRQLSLQPRQGTSEHSRACLEPGAAWGPDPWGSVPGAGEGQREGQAQALGWALLWGKRLSMNPGLSGSGWGVRAAAIYEPRPLQDAQEMGQFSLAIHGLRPCSLRLASGPSPGLRPTLSTLSFPGHFGAIKRLVWLNLKLPSQIQFHARLVPSRRAAQPGPSLQEAGPGGQCHLLFFPLCWAGGGGRAGNPPNRVSSFSTAHPRLPPAPAASWVASCCVAGGGGWEVVGSLWPPLQL